MSERAIGTMILVVFCFLASPDAGASEPKHSAPPPTKTGAPASLHAEPACYFRPLLDIRYSLVERQKTKEDESLWNHYQEIAKAGNREYKKLFTGVFPSPRVKSTEPEKLSTAELLATSLYLHRTIQTRQHYKDYFTRFKSATPMVLHSDESTAKTIILRAPLADDPQLAKSLEQIDALLLKRASVGQVLQGMDKDKAKKGASVLPPQRNGRIHWNGVEYDRAFLEKALAEGDGSGIDFAALSKQPLAEWHGKSTAGYGKLGFLQAQLLPYLSLNVAEERSEEAFPKAMPASSALRSELMRSEAAAYCKEKTEIHHRLGPIGKNLAELNEILARQAPFRGLPVALRHYLGMNPQLLEMYVEEARAGTDDAGARSVLEKLRHIERRDLFDPNDQSKFAFKKAAEATKEHFDKIARNDPKKFIFRGADGKYQVCQNDRECGKLLEHSKELAGAAFPPALLAPKSETKESLHKSAFTKLADLRWPEDRAKIEAIFFHLNAAEHWRNPHAKEGEKNDITPKQIRDALEPPVLLFNKQWMTKFAENENDCEKRSVFKAPSVPALDRYKWAYSILQGHEGRQYTPKGKGVDPLHRAEQMAKSISDTVFLFELDHEDPDYLYSPTFLRQAQSILDAHVRRSPPPPPAAIDLAKPGELQKHSAAFETWAMKELARISSRDDDKDLDKLPDSASDFATRAALVFLIHRAAPKAAGLCLEESPQWRGVEHVTKLAVARFPDLRLPYSNQILHALDERKLRITPEEAERLQKMPLENVKKSQALIAFVLQAAPEMLRRLTIGEHGAVLSPQLRKTFADGKVDDPKVIPLVFLPVPKEAKDRVVTDPANLLRKSVLATNEAAARAALQSIFSKEPGFADTRGNLFGRLDGLAKNVLGKTLSGLYCEPKGVCPPEKLAEAPTEAELATAIRLANLYLMAFRRGEVVPAFTKADPNVDELATLWTRFAEREREWMHAEGKNLMTAEYWGFAGGGKQDPEAAKLVASLGKDHVLTPDQAEVRDKAILPLIRDVFRGKDGVQWGIGVAEQGKTKLLLHDLDGVLDETLTRLTELSGLAAAGANDTSSLGKTASLVLNNAFAKRTTFVDKDGKTKAIGVYGVPIDAIPGSTDDLLWRALKGIRDSKGAPDVSKFSIGSYYGTGFEKWIDYVNKVGAKIDADYSGVVFENETSVENTKKGMNNIFSLKAGDNRVHIVLEGAPPHVTKIATAIQKRNHYSNTKAEAETNKELANLRVHAPEVYSQLVSYFKVLPDSLGRRLVLASRYPQSVLDCDKANKEKAAEKDSTVVRFDYPATLERSPRSAIAAEWARMKTGNVGTCDEVKARIENAAARYFGPVLSERESNEIKLTKINPFSCNDHEASKEWLKEFQKKHLSPVVGKGLAHQDREELIRLPPDLSPILDLKARAMQEVNARVMAWYTSPGGASYKVKNGGLAIDPIPSAGSIVKYDHKVPVKWQVGNNCSTTRELTFIRNRLLAQLAIVRSCLEKEKSCGTLAPMAGLDALVDLTKAADGPERQKAQWVERSLLSSIQYVDETLVRADTHNPNARKLEIDPAVGRMKGILADTAKHRTEFDRRRAWSLLNWNAFVTDGYNMQVAPSGTDRSFTSVIGAYRDFFLEPRNHKDGNTKITVQVQLTEEDKRSPVSDLLTRHDAEPFSHPSAFDKQTRVTAYMKKHAASEVDVAAAMFEPHLSSEIAPEEMKRLASQPAFMAHLVLYLTRADTLPQKTRDELRGLILPGKLFHTLLSDPDLRGGLADLLEAEAAESYAVVSANPKLKATPALVAEQRALAVLLGPLGPAEVLSMAAEPGKFSAGAREAVRAQLYAELTKLLVGRGVALDKIKALPHPAIQKLAMETLITKGELGPITEYLESGRRLGVLAQARNSSLAAQTLLLLITALEEGGDTETGTTALAMESMKGGAARFTPEFRVWGYEKEKAERAAHYDVDYGKLELKVDLKAVTAPVAALKIPPPRDEAEVKKLLGSIDKKFHKHDFKSGPKFVDSVSSTLESMWSLMEVYTKHYDGELCRISNVLKATDTDAATKARLQVERQILRELRVSPPNYLDVMDAAAKADSKATIERAAIRDVLFDYLRQVVLARGVKLEEIDPNPGKAVRMFAKAKLADSEWRMLHAMKGSTNGLSELAKAEGTSYTEELLLTLLSSLTRSNELELVTRTGPVALPGSPKLVDMSAPALAKVATKLRTALSGKGIRGVPPAGSLTATLGTFPAKATRDAMAETLFTDVTKIEFWTSPHRPRFKAEESAEEQKLMQTYYGGAKLAFDRFNELDEKEVGDLDRVLAAATDPVGSDRRKEGAELMYGMLDKMLAARGADIKGFKGSRAQQVRAYAQKEIAEHGDARAAYGFLPETGGMLAYGKSRGTSPPEEMILLLAGLLDPAPPPAPEPRIFEPMVDLKKAPAPLAVASKCAPIGPAEQWAKALPTNWLTPKKTNGHGLEYWLERMAKGGRNMTPLQRVNFLENYNDASDRQLKQLAPVLAKLRSYDPKANGEQELLRLVQLFDAQEVSDSLMVYDRNGALVFGPGQKTPGENRALIVSQLVTDGKLDEKGKFALVDWAHHRFVSERLADITAMFLNVQSKDSIETIQKSLEKMKTEELVRAEQELRAEAFAVKLASYRKQKLAEGADPVVLDRELMALAKNVAFEHVPDSSEASKLELLARTKHGVLVKQARSVIGDCDLCGPTHSRDPYHVNSAAASAAAAARFEGGGGKGKEPEGPSPAAFKKAAEAACAAWDKQSKQLSKRAEDVRDKFKAAEKEWFGKIFETSKVKKIHEVAARDALLEKRTLVLKLEEMAKRIATIKGAVHNADNVKQLKEMEQVQKYSAELLKEASGRLDMAKMKLDQLARNFRDVRDAYIKTKKSLEDDFGRALLVDANEYNKNPTAARRNNFFVEKARDLVPKSWAESFDASQLLPMMGRRFAQYCELKDTASKVGAGIARSGHGADFKTHALYKASLAPEIIASTGLPVGSDEFDGIVKGELDDEQSLATKREASHGKLKKWQIDWDGSHNFSYTNFKIDAKDMVDSEGTPPKGMPFSTVAKTFEEFQKFMPLDREHAQAAWISHVNETALAESFKDQIVDRWAELGFPPLFEFGKTAVKVTGEYPDVSIEFFDLALMRRRAQELAKTISVATNEFVTLKLSRWSGSHNNMLNHIPFAPWSSIPTSNEAVKAALKDLPAQFAKLKEYGQLNLDPYESGSTLQADLMAKQFEMQHKHSTLFNVQQMATQINEDVGSMQRQFWITAGLIALSFIPGGQAGLLGVVKGAITAARLGAVLHVFGGIVEGATGSGYRWSGGERDFWIGTGSFAAGNLLGAGARHLLKIGQGGMAATLTEMAGIGLADFGGRTIADLVQGLPVDLVENVIGAGKTSLTAAGADQIIARRMPNFWSRAAVSFTVLHFGVSPTFMWFEELWHHDKINKQMDQTSARLAELLKDTKRAEENKAEIDKLKKEMSEMTFASKYLHSLWAQALPHMHFASVAGAHGRTHHLQHALAHAGEPGAPSLRTVMLLEGIDPARYIFDSHQPHKFRDIPVRTRWLRGSDFLGFSANPYDAMAQAAGQLRLRDVESIVNRGTAEGASREAQTVLDVAATLLGFEARRLREIIPKVIEALKDKDLVFGTDEVHKKAIELAIADIRVELAVANAALEDTRVADMLLMEMFNLDRSLFTEVPVNELDLNRPAHEMAVTLAAFHFQLDAERFRLFVERFRPPGEMTWEQLAAEYRRLDPTFVADLTRPVHDGTMTAEGVAEMFPSMAPEIRAAIDAAAPGAVPRLTDLGTALETARAGAGTALPVPGLRYLGASLTRLSPTEEGAVRAALRQQLGRAPTAAEVQATVAWMRATLVAAVPKVTPVTPFGLDGRNDRANMTLFQGRTVENFLAGNGEGRVVALGNGSVARALGVPAGQRATLGDLILVNNQGRLVVIEAIAARNRVSAQAVEAAVRRIRNTSIELLQPARDPRIPASSLAPGEIALSRGVTLDGYTVSPTGTLLNAEGQAVRIELFGTFRDVRIRWID